MTNKKNNTLKDIKHSSIFILKLCIAPIYLCITFYDPFSSPLPQNPLNFFTHIFINCLIHQEIIFTTKLHTQHITATLNLQLITPNMHLVVHAMDWTRNLHQLLLYGCKLHLLVGYPLPRTTTLYNI